MLVGLEARVAHAEAVVLDALQHPACILKFIQAEQLAFIDGALSPAGSPVPMMLVDEDYLVQAFLSGQEKRRNKYGFALGGRWVYRREVCRRCQKADYPIVKPHEVCSGCFVDYARQARHHEGAVLASLRELKRRKQDGYDGKASDRLAHATPVRSLHRTPSNAVRSSYSGGLPHASARRLGGRIKEDRMAISDAEAATFRCRPCVPSAVLDA